MEVKRRRDGFTLIWRIRNFSYCLLKKGSECLRSPCFIVEELEQTQISLLLFQGDRGYDDYISFGLSKFPCLEIGRMRIDYEFSFLSEEGLPLITKRREGIQLKPRRKEDLIFLKVPRDEVLKTRRVEFLPQDILIVRCRIWRTGDVLSEAQECFVTTEIEVQRKYFSFVIDDFEKLQPKEIRSRPWNYPSEDYSSNESLSDSVSSDECQSNAYPSFLMNAWYSDEMEGKQKFHVEIHLRSVERDVTEEGIFATCRLSLIDARGDVSTSVYDEHNFYKFDIWKFPAFLNRLTLLANKDLYLPNDTLTLECEFATSVGIAVNEIEDSDEDFFTGVARDVKKRMPLTYIGNLETMSNTMANLYELYKEGLFCDLNLVANGEKFPIHRNVLGARSPVFRAMLSSDMREKASQDIDIPEDADTVRRMLLYVYTDTIDDLDFNASMNLYFAAEKYELLSLKELCSSYLKAGMDVYNVSEALVLADMHQDDNLKSCIMKFILSNLNDVTDSEEWKALENNFPRLTSEFWRQMYFSKSGYDTNF